MTTKLDKTIKRELGIGDATYTIQISPMGIKITPKGGRKGTEWTWTRLLRGDTMGAGMGG